MVLPEDRFQANVVGLFHFTRELISDLYDKKMTKLDPNLVELVGGVLTAFDKNKLIENFIYYSHSHWGKILSKDEDFFLMDSTLFGDLPLENVNSLKILFSKDSDGNPLIMDDDKNDIWSFLHGMIRITIKYIHLKRNPTTVKTQGGTLATYKYEFYQEIDIPEIATEWNVDLEWHNLTLR